MLHPAHAAVAAEVASWYTTSAPGMGYLLEERWCGLFTTDASLIGPRVILRVEDPNERSAAFELFVLDLKRAVSWVAKAAA